MTRKYNTQQRAYILARAHVDTLKDQEQAIEQDYMKAHGITTPDGGTPSRIWMIDDEDAFDVANEATAPAVDALGLYEAETLLGEAEDALINYGLSIIPAKEREILRRPCFGLEGDYVHIDTRKKVIDLTMSLDVATVRYRLHGREGAEQ